jgi:hypothetical protein
MTKASKIEKNSMMTKGNHASSSAILHPCRIGANAVTIAQPTNAISTGTSARTRIPRDSRVTMLSSWLGNPPQIVSGVRWAIATANVGVRKQISHARAYPATRGPLAGKGSGRM